MSILFDNENVSAGIFSSAVIFGGGQKIATIRADDFGGGAFVLQTIGRNDKTPDRWTDIINGSFTENSQVRLNYTSVNQQFRVQLVGGTGATNVFIEIAE